MIDNGDLFDVIIRGQFRDGLSRVIGFADNDVSAFCGLFKDDGLRIQDAFWFFRNVIGPCSTAEMISRK